MAKSPKTNPPQHTPNTCYFEPPLAWQAGAWIQVVNQYRHQHLPHAMLASGIVGIGKRAFVYRLAAFLLCQDEHKITAQQPCGHCSSCHWLLTNTHPDLTILPKQDDDISKNTPIKIDDIRQLQESIYTKNAHARVIILDNADQMTQGAANALLKILEEPTLGVYWLLISDNPNNLLPTIKSRVQNLPLLPIDVDLALDFVKAQGFDDKKAWQLLQESQFAPLAAIDLPKRVWYDQKKAWLQTFVALRTGKRSVTQASDYWQKNVPLADFLVLTYHMLLDVWRVSLQLPSLYDEIDTQAMIQACPIDEPVLLDVLAVIDDIGQAIQQNVQQKLSYERLLSAFKG